MFSLDEETKKAIEGAKEAVGQLRRDSLKLVLQAKGYGPPEEDIPPKTRQRAHAARPLLPEHELIGPLAEEIAPRFDEKKGTTRRWLTDKNPLYDSEAPGTWDEKYARFRIAVLRIVAFTESP